MPDIDCIDDWEAAGVKSKQDIHDLFVPRFFFGCEADDLTIAHAFNRHSMHGGAQLQALFSSDVAHWDVPDMTEPVTLGDADIALQDHVHARGGLADLEKRFAIGVTPDLAKPAHAVDVVLHKARIGLIVAGA